jgi:hypothetical protein
MMDPLDCLLMGGIAMVPRTESKRPVDRALFGKRGTETDQGDSNSNQRDCRPVFEKPGDHQGPQAQEGTDPGIGSAHVPLHISPRAENTTLKLGTGPLNVAEAYVNGL